MAGATLKAMGPTALRWGGAARPPVLVFFLLLASGVSHAQQLLQPEGGAVRLFNSDSAILEAQEARKDLPCTVTPAKPSLGFDLRFHAGYDVSIPLKELAGPENALTMLFRVIPSARPEDPVYFDQRLVVPPIDEDAKGDAALQGTFDVGEGKYHVDWLMRDRAGHVCSAFWDVDVSLPPRDKQIALDIAPGTVLAAEAEPFKQESPAAGEPHNGPLNVKIIVNFAPQDSASAALQPVDTTALVSILRSIARERRIGRFSIVAFNAQAQRVIYREQDAPEIDFPALGEALKSVNLGTIDLKRLGQKHGDSEFLAELITREIKDQPDKPDAVIFAGPKIILDEGLPPEMLKELGDVAPPVFYMNYNLNPQVNPWRDAIGNAVHALKGAEFTISRPRDVFFAWTEIIGRIVKLKFGRTATGNASSQ